MKERRKREYPEKTPGDELQKMPKLQAPSETHETRTHTLALVVGVRKERRRTKHNTTRRPYTLFYCHIISPMIQSSLTLSSVLAADTTERKSFVRNACSGTGLGMLPGALDEMKQDSMMQNSVIIQDVLF